MVKYLQQPFIFEKRSVPICKHRLVVIPPQQSHLQPSCWFQEMLLLLLFSLAVTSKHLMVFNLQQAVRNRSSSPWLCSTQHSEKLKHLLQLNGLVSLVLLLSQTSSLAFPLQDYLSFFFPPLCVHLTLVWVYPNHFTMNGAFVHLQCFSPRNNPAEITRMTLGEKPRMSQEK